MKEHTILVTGDYWHPDFERLLRNLDVPVTLVPINKVVSVRETAFDLIVIAQARRDQFSHADVEGLQSCFPNTPIVALLGSWCEGELRSGAAWPGVIRVYWHQWDGRYEQFVHQLGSAGLTEWHAPRTASVADRTAAKSAPDSGTMEIECVGISAWTRTQFEMVADAVSHFGWENRWIERATWDGATSSLVSVMVVDADGWSSDLENRLKWLREELPNTPIVLMLNYPRQNEQDEMSIHGVLEVVSKPFELDDLNMAIQRAVARYGEFANGMSAEF